ncbi:MAG: hypothetical protein A2095_02805 [Sphingomonadales bacterium GWF1_63_6]|nr:MAG: hypothetical protein A2095_02805 [Sphingomonadales bacterium GWF1_63_6]
MNADILNDLAARVEAGEGVNGADRELHCLIFQAIGAPVPFQFANKFIALTFVEKEQAYFVELGDGMRIRYEPPSYTSSIDAAMTLVPEGLRFEVTTTGYRPGATVCGNILTGVHEGSYAATPALALTAAALRAHAAIAKENEGG